MSIDHTQTGYLFKARKTLRYVALYGVSRTLVKIRGQYHMKSTTDFRGTRWVNSGCRSPDAPERCVALIGCGNYAFANIGYYLHQHSRRFLRLVYDRHLSRAISLCKAYRGAAAVTDWHDILTDPGVKIVYIAASHSSQAEFALACIDAGKHVHIEKPHVVSAEQLQRLTAAMRRHPQVKVFLGFNRPRSSLFRQLQAALARQPGPLMINCCVVGHAIPPGHWYFNAGEGGQILGNLCHWTDLTLHLVSLQNAFPCQIISGTPPGARSDFVVSIIFADRSCAAITFSTKGHAFEGVREMISVQRGEVLANISDFQTLTVEQGAHKSRKRLRHRDHGHKANIVNSLEQAVTESAGGEDIRYVAATARLFMAVREAVEQGGRVSVAPDDILPATGDT